MDLLFILNSILIGAALAMDAFSVSLAYGLNEPGMKRKRMITIAGIFAFFQFIMPLIGWICIATIAKYFNVFYTLIPWIALVLLSYIGGSMLIEGIKGIENDNISSNLFVAGIATSIDALSVGFTIAEYDFVPALIEALIICAVTYIICRLGVIIGRKLGTRLSGKASILGGVILIIIGLEIFIKGIFL